MIRHDLGTRLQNGSKWLADVSGSLSVGGTFEPVDSKFEDITVSGTATVGSLSATSATIDDSATIQNLSVGANADVSGDLNVMGTVGSDVLDCQDIKVSGTANVNSLVAKMASVEEVASIEMLNVGSNADVSGDLIVEGAITNDELQNLNTNDDGDA